MIISSAIPTKYRQIFYSRQIVWAALRDVELNSIPESEIIRIDFISNYPGVRLPVDIEEEFIDNNEARIIFKTGQFWNLNTDYFGFSVDVIIGGITQTIKITFASILQYENTMQDISIKFQQIPKTLSENLRF